jgi:hypothetical protein
MIPTAGSATLNVKTTAVPSTAEAIATFSVSDSTANLNIGNAATTDGTFVPSLSHAQANGNINSASLYQGFIYNTDDTGTNPVNVFRAQTQTTLGVLASVVTRPVFQFRNWTTNILTMLSNGRVGIGTSTPSEVLDVVGNVNVSGSVVASNLPFIPPSQGNEADHHVIVNMGSSILQNTGNMTSGTTGTAALANFSGATFIGKLPHISYNTTSTAGSTCGHRMTLSFFGIGGGIRFQTIFQVSDAAPVANARHFCGLNTSSTATAVNSSTNNNPLVSSLTNFIAFAHDGGAGDTNFCIYHNAGSAGSTTRIDLGASFPITNTGEVYQVHFYSPYNSNNVMYEIKALVSGAVARGTITTNLPTTSQLYFHNERFNGGTSNNVKFEAGSLFGWTGA